MRPYRQSVRFASKFVDSAWPTKERTLTLASLSQDQLAGEGYDVFTGLAGERMILCWKDGSVGLFEVGEDD
jgi:hypothetical protein